LSLNYLLESLCVSVVRPKIGRDAAKGVTQAWPASGANVIAQNIPCSLQQAGANVQLLYAMRQTFVNTQLFFDRDPGVQVNDFITVQSTDEGGNQVTHKCLARSKTQPVALGQLWACDCEEIL
jgi:hypothetical protein